MSFGIEQFYKLFQGALVFQCLFLIFLYFTANKKDILFYCLYLLLLAVYFFWNAPNTFFNLNDDSVFNSPFYVYANTPLIILTHLCYIYFLKHFFSSYFQSTTLAKYINFFKLLAPVLIMISVTSTYFLKSNQYIFYLVNFFSTGISIYILVYLYQNKIKGVKLVAAGMVLNIIGNFFTVLMIILWKANVHHTLTENYPLLFMRCGILADIFLYVIAILQKLIFNEKQLAIQKLETQLTVEKVKNQISKELHDDIGSHLSGIQMYSHLAKQEALKGNISGSSNALDIIQNASEQVVNSLKDMVWLIQPGNDSLQSLADKIYEYAILMAGAKNIQLVFESGDKEMASNISTEWRHQVFMIVKEAINNAVKYSQAGLLALTVKENNSYLEISICDDGKGFNLDTKKHGNGLNNMQKRANELGADFNIQSKTGDGCLVYLKLKITQ